MSKIIQKLDSQKGASMIEMLAVLATATVVVGGVSFNASDFLNHARDAQRVANLKQIVNVLEVYYLDHDVYPSVEKGSRFDNLIYQLESYLNSLPNDTEKYDYYNFDSSQRYLLKVILENPDNPVLETDFDGQVEEVDCQDPAYCIKI